MTVVLQLARVAAQLAVLSESYEREMAKSKAELQAQAQRTAQLTVVVEATRQRTDQLAGQMGTLPDVCRDASVVINEGMCGCAEDIMAELHGVHRRLDDLADSVEEELSTLHSQHMELEGGGSGCSHWCM